jgi:hypothetical protein
MRAKYLSSITLITGITNYTQTSITSHHDSQSVSHHSRGIQRSQDISLRRRICDDVGRCLRLCLSCSSSKLGHFFIVNLLESLLMNALSVEILFTGESQSDDLLLVYYLDIFSHIIYIPAPFQLILLFQLPEQPLVLDHWQLWSVHQTMRVE